MNWKRESTRAVEQVTRPATKLKNIELIKEHEGLRLTAYLPTPNDVWTIGYGHTKTARQGMTITARQAEDLLYSDLAWVEKVIADKVKVNLTQNQYDALASLIFNIGATAFGKSTVLRKLNAGDYRGAADAFLMWNKQRNKSTGKMDVLRGETQIKSPFYDPVFKFFKLFIPETDHQQIIINREIDIPGKYHLEIRQKFHPDTFLFSPVDQFPEILAGFRHQGRKDLLHVMLHTVIDAITFSAQHR